MTYVISSHSDARLSSIHGTYYDTLDEALFDVRRMLSEEPVLVDVDDGFALYSSQEDADADDMGQAPHKVIAAIYKV